jgi:hypothetical protein
MWSGLSMYFEPASYPLDCRAEIDRDRRHDRRRQQRHDDREAEADVAENRMAAEALEHVH